MSNKETLRKFVDDGLSKGDLSSVDMYIHADAVDHSLPPGVPPTREGFKMFFGTPENPGTVARSTIQVAALAGPAFLVEIEATAAKMPK